jgi:hypothetical protein
MKKIILGVAAMVCLFAVHAAADIGITVSPASWAIGTVGASYYVQSPSSFAVTNNGTCYETLKINVANSASWHLVTAAPGQDQFKLTRYDNPTGQWLDLYNTTTTLITWFAINASTTMPLRFYGPASIAETPAQQTINVIFSAVAESGFSYNQAGDFYWSDYAVTTHGSDQPTPDNSFLGTSTYWSYLPTQDWSYMTPSSSNGWLPASLGLSFVKGSTNGGAVWNSYWQGFLSGWTLPTINPAFIKTATTICPVCNNTGAWYWNSATAMALNPYYWSATGHFFNGGTGLNFVATAWAETNSLMSTSYHGALSTWTNVSTTWYNTLIVSYTTTFNYFYCPVCNYFEFYQGSLTTGYGSTTSFPATSTWVKSFPTGEATPVEAVILN